MVWWKIMDKTKLAAWLTIYARISRLQLIHSKNWLICFSLALCLGIHPIENVSKINVQFFPDNLHTGRQCKVDFAVDRRVRLTLAGSVSVGCLVPHLADRDDVATGNDATSSSIWDEWCWRGTQLLTADRPWREWERLANGLDRPVRVSGPLVTAWNVIWWHLLNIIISIIMIFVIVIVICFFK